MYWKEGQDHTRVGADVEAKWQLLFFLPITCTPADEGLTRYTRRHHTDWPLEASVVAGTACMPHPERQPGRENSQWRRLLDSCWQPKVQARDETVREWCHMSSGGGCQKHTHMPGWSEVASTKRVLVRQVRGRTSYTASTSPVNRNVKQAELPCERAEERCARTPRFCRSR